MFIPVMRPLLPDHRALLPYLRRIDESRYYSNYGPLVLALEERLAARYGLPVEAITTVANATLGLIGTLLALELPVGGLCAMPAWTFIATPQAAQLAGLIPWFLDVDPATWALDPRDVECRLSQAPGPVEAVMPVLPFGRPCDLAAWETFRARTGIPVVVDAAAAFDALHPGNLPCVVSLHATKALGCGEGGFLLCSDISLVRRVRNFTVFGFQGSREAVQVGGNAKMSEYAAAVGLAGLEAWPETRAGLAGRAAIYMQAFEGADAVRLPLGFGCEWIATTCVVSLPPGSSPAVAQALGAAGIESRQWWGYGAHDHPTMARHPAGPLDVTKMLSSSTLGLPFWRDLPDAAIEAAARVTLKTARSATW
jgi:dTDP-4-amino-4,6-dideoxygalactose transaminase